MPLFEFECGECEEAEELLLKAGEKGKIPKCPKCGGYMVRCLSSGSFVIPTKGCKR